MNIPFKGFIWPNQQGHISKWYANTNVNGDKSNCDEIFSGSGTISISNCCIVVVNIRENSKSIVRDIGECAVSYITKYGASLPSDYIIYEADQESIFWNDNSTVWSENLLYCKFISIWNTFSNENNFYTHVFFSSNPSFSSW